jgi:hypothetical protein
MFVYINIFNRLVEAMHIILKYFAFGLDFNNIICFWEKRLTRLSK